MIHNLIARLKQDTHVTAITTADRIFPLIRLQGSQVPALVLQLVGATPEDTKDLTSTLDLDVVEITGLAKDPATCWTLMEAVRDSLDGWASGYVAEVRFRTHASDIFESSDLFTITATYSVRMTRDGLTLPATLGGLGYDAHFRGAVSYEVEDYTAEAGAQTTLGVGAGVLFVDYTNTSSPGTFKIYLPPVAKAAGHTIRILTGEYLDNSHDVEVYPDKNDSSAGIDGAASFNMDRPFDGLTVLEHGGTWLIAQRKSK